MPEQQVDRVLVSIMGRALKAICDEMSLCMEKTTRSPILCEAKDFVTGLYDAEGKMLEQTENLPILSFSLSPVCAFIADKYQGNIYPGDVIFHNDVFTLGNQNNDVATFKPIFKGEKLVAWSAAKGHMADIGGAVRGGYNPNATEVWQEALRIPAVKVYERGKLRKDVWDLIFANIRLSIVAEDMRAEIGSCTVGERRLLELIEKYGLESFELHTRHLFDASRKMMEAELRAIPNGVYKGDGRADEWFCQWHLHIERVGDGPDLLANGQPRHPAQRWHVTALGDDHSRGDDPQCGLSCGHDLRQPSLPAERRCDHQGPGSGHPKAGDGGVEPTVVFALDRN